MSYDFGQNKFYSEKMGGFSGDDYSQGAAGYKNYSVCLDRKTIQPDRKTISTQSHSIQFVGAPSQQSLLLVYDRQSKSRGCVLKRVLEEPNLRTIIYSTASLLTRCCGSNDSCEGGLHARSSVVESSSVKPPSRLTSVVQGASIYVWEGKGFGILFILEEKELKGKSLDIVGLLRESVILGSQ